MSRGIRQLAAGAAAALILALAVGSAAARNLSASSQTIRAVWNPLTFSGEGVAEFRCRLTIEGSFHSRTIAKVARSLTGAITRAIIGRPCERNTAWAFNGAERNEVLGNTTLPNTLPWHITYEGFAGTLPNITRINFLIDRGRFLSRATILGFPVLCQYTLDATAGRNAAAIAEREAAGAITTLTADPTRRISSDSEGCPTAAFSGTGTVTVLNSTSRVTITLI